MLCCLQIIKHDHAKVKAELFLLILPGFYFVVSSKVFLSQFPNFLLFQRDSLHVSSMKAGGQDRDLLPALLKWGFLLFSSCFTHISTYFFMLSISGFSACWNLR